jgi:xanthine dehydrogenase YagS FAD-binding subunit
MTTMAEAERHPLLRKRFPAAQLALALAASPQIREMATLGGNLLQRTRCPYFRDARSPCNKRVPGSGCSGIGSEEVLAILGTSEACIAPYAGDFAVAMAMLGAEVSIENSEGSTRRMPISNLHRLPGDTPHIESWLDPGDLITAIHLPYSDWTGQTYVKLRDRASYAFASASAAVSLRLERGIIADARIALGGLATVPWRSKEAEDWLVGRAVDTVTAMEAGRKCLAAAQCSPGQETRRDIGTRAVARAVLDAGASRHGAD